MPPVALWELLLLARQAADAGVVAAVLRQGALRKHVAQAGRGARPPQRPGLARCTRLLRPCARASNGNDQRVELICATDRPEAACDGQPAAGSNLQAMTRTTSRCALTFGRPDRLLTQLA